MAISCVFNTLSQLNRCRPVLLLLATVFITLPYLPIMSDSPERVKLSKEEKDRRFQAELMPVLDPLYNFAYRLTLDEDDANDLVQETYLKAYRFFEYFEPGTNAKAWLFRILKNSFINDFRKKSKQPAKVDYSEVEGYYNPDEVEGDADTGASSSDLRQQSSRDLIGDEVASALNSLPVDFRTVIILCDLEGFTYEEMAKVLDIPTAQCVRACTGLAISSRISSKNTPPRWAMGTKRWMTSLMPPNPKMNKLLLFSPFNPG
jgi:RNA polymerase sigma factor (sigma-70 family)